MQAASKSFPDYPPLIPSINSKGENTSKSNINFFDYLPEELVIVMAQYLDTRAIGNFRLACKKFNVIAKDASLIPIFFKKRFPILSGFYTQKEMTEELYQKAISIEKNIHNPEFRPETTVFKKNIAFGGIGSLAFSEGLLYSRHPSYPDKDIVVWDLNGTQLDQFKSKCRTESMGITKNYIFSPLPSMKALQRINKSDKKSIEWEYPEGDFWCIRVFDELLYAKSSSGIMEIDSESGLKREYLGKAFSPFFADQSQVLGSGSSYIISWDRETQKIKEEFPFDNRFPNHKTCFTFHAYPDDNRCIFGESGGKLIIYDLRQRQMISTEALHQTVITGMVFFNNEVVTAAYDQNCKIWDVRCLTSLNNDLSPIRSFKIGFPIKSLCSQGSSLFIGSHNIYKYDFSKEEPN
ncbi:F-box/WD repeat-containing protein [Criblamydia sequanensis]|uniref:F-box and WD repeat-containing protein n=1 Tax=Candidatus Criblamydia sequanensis CRIB-18 TaxID=1437425 RepID=A0A090D0Y1_9BACT|nr:F-box/WD repeat-containing protein [Criblamydia sequanensis]CDR33550.1 F-box and WD repeat-containing protein [Criblamydia sequanensis CRIB-18]